MGSQRLQQQAQELHGSAPGPQHVCYSCLLGAFARLLTAGVGVSLILLCALGTLLLLLGSLVQPLCDGFALI